MLSSSAKPEAPWLGKNVMTESSIRKQAMLGNLKTARIVTD